MVSFNDIRYALLFMFLFVVSQLEGQPKWHETVGPYGGVVNSVSSNDNGFIAAASGGMHIFYSIDSGNNWTRTNKILGDGSNVAMIWVNNNGDMFVKGKATYRSTDHGTTWTTLDMTSGDIFYFIDDGNTIYARKDYQLAMSTNDGDSWSNIGVDAGSSITSVSVCSNNDIFISDINKGILRSKDGGFNWYEKNNGLLSTEINIIVSNGGDSLYCGSKNGILYFSDDYGDNWLPLYTLPSGYIIWDIDISSDNDIYVFSREYNLYHLDGFIHVSRDNGINWEEIWYASQDSDSMISTLGSNSITTTNNELFVATQRGVAYSCDSGISWNYRNTGIDNLRFRGLAISEQGTIYASTAFPTHLFRTENGTSWTKLEPTTKMNRFMGGGAYTPSIAISKTNAVYYAVYDTLFRSQDDGSSWNGMLISGVRVIVIDSINTHIVGASNGIYRSLDNGESWVHVKELSHTIWAITIACDSILYAYGENKLYKSDNHGATWSAVSITNFGYTNGFLGSKNGVLYLLWGSVYTSRDGGVSWDNLDVNSDYTAHTMLITPQNNYYLGTQSGLLVSTDEGNTWKEINNGLPSGIISGTPTIGIDVLAYSSNGKVYCATDQYYENGGIFWIYDDHLSPSAPSVLNVSAGDKQVTISWHPVTEEDFGVYRIYYGASPEPTSIADSTSSILDTTVTVTGLTNGTAYYFRVTAADTFGNESDFSNEVSATPFNTPPADFALITPVADDTHIITDDNFSSPYTFTWEHSDDVDGDAVSYLFIPTGNLFLPSIVTLDTQYIVAFDTLIGLLAKTSESIVESGHWHVKATDGKDTTGATNGPRPLHLDIRLSPRAIDPLDHLPKTYALHQSYPNPFNPTATIRYDLPEASNITILVYDILGREIVRLLDGYIEPGYRQITWNGKDNAGRDVPTGIYIARLVTPEYTRSIKMMLLQ